MDDQLLDDGFDKVSTFPPGMLRWSWHLKLATIIISFHVFVLFLILFVLPFLPKFLGDGISFFLVGLIIFGLFGITLYVCKVGYQWNWGATLIGGGFLFFSSFIYIMTNLNSWVSICTPIVNNWLDIPPRMLKDILDIMLVGLAYSVISILVTEFFAILNLIWKQVR